MKVLIIPQEKTSIENAYLKFVDWATSSGGSFDDWYQDINGYRNESNIYVIPYKINFMV